MLQVDLFRSAGISEEDIQKLQMAVSAYQEARKQPQHKMPHIVCTGIYNAGKSTLLNALIGEDKFPTGDIPTTKALAQAESGGAVYIDTPGLNAAEEDDAETQAAYANADFILFVANAQGGGVTEAEAVWLRKLKERYTEESLKRRLIYVLTHCTQVNEEQLPAIREHVCVDLEKAVGFAPEQIICVDSVTYQKGKKEGKPLLVEDGGIHHLQRRIAERVKEADTLLAQAREAEIVSRRKDALEQIMQVRSTVQSAVDGTEKQSRMKTAEIDRVWAEFEEALEKAMPQKNIKPIYLHVDWDFRDFGRIKDRSESSVKRKIEERMRTYYDKRDRIVNDAIETTMRGIRKAYCSAGLESAYTDCCSKITSVFSRSILSLQKHGIQVSAEISEISVVPDIPSNLASEVTKDLQDGAVDHGGIYSLSEYVAYARIDTLTEYERGWLGREREVMVYCYYYGGRDVFQEMEKDVRKNLERNTSFANGTLNGVWQSFIKKLLPEVEKHKSALKQQVNDYKATLSQSSAPANLLTALAHLDTLKREVSQ